MDYLATLLVFLPIASFALAVGTLVARIKLQEKGARPHLVTALIVFAGVASLATVLVLYAERLRIARLADDVVTVIGNSRKTYDEILIEVKSPAGASLPVALDLLDKEQRIGSQVSTITSKADDKEYRVRIYFVRTFNQ